MIKITFKHQLFLPIFKGIKLKAKNVIDKQKAVKIYQEISNLKLVKDLVYKEVLKDLDTLK